MGRWASWRLGFFEFLGFRFFRVLGLLAGFRVVLGVFGLSVHFLLVPVLPLLGGCTPFGCLVVYGV